MSYFFRILSSARLDAGAHVHPVGVKLSDRRADIFGPQAPGQEIRPPHIADELPVEGLSASGPGIEKDEIRLGMPRRFKILLLRNAEGFYNEILRSRKGIP